MYFRISSNSHTMKTIGYVFAVLLTAGALLTSCSKEQKQENCIVGRWLRSTGYCSTMTEYTFNADGSGWIKQDTCTYSCSTELWRVRSSFTYQITASGLTITLKDLYSCDSLLSTNNGTTNTVAFTCDGSVMTYGSITLLKQ